MSKNMLDGPQLTKPQVFNALTYEAICIWKGFKSIAALVSVDSKKGLIVVLTAILRWTHLRARSASSDFILLSLVIDCALTLPPYSISIFVCGFYHSGRIQTSPICINTTPHVKIYQEWQLQNATLPPLKVSELKIKINMDHLYTFDSPSMTHSPMINYRKDAKKGVKFTFMVVGENLRL